MKAVNSQEAIVKLVNLSKVYDGKAVVNKLNIAISPGVFCGILGPNGAGKTTTLRMLIGHCPIDSGELSVFGLSVFDNASKIRASVGVVPQMDNLDPDFTVEENLHVYGKFFGLGSLELKDRIKELLEFSSLEEKANSKISELSGGMRRRLTLARALINKPKLLILDEPTTGLDPQARQAIWQKLRELKKQGLTLILTTHYMEEAERLCDRVIVMDHGEVMADAPPKQLIKSEIEAHVLEVHAANEFLIEELKQDKSMARFEHSGDICFFYGEKLSHALDVLERSSHDDYLFRPANLEDVFIKLTGRDLRE
ncbi:MAG: ABC transporter [Cycloclasticus sp. symbiont of Bathymodiolus heckerae]|nr:MAG: ABC transporter [Cycloclasticus sp. symbiont of Bathymodiolus heckerae]